MLNFLKGILPSYRSGKDPLQVVMSDGSKAPYAPIPLGDVKLTPWMHYKIYSERRQAIKLTPAKYDKKLAVIIPYRQREQHLQTLVPALHEQLEQQEISHEIIVIEQADEKLFNKGRLLNIGAKIAAARCDYFCFHDVDMVPESASYGYIPYPVLLANSVSQFDQDSTKLSQVWQHHASYFGGVILFPKADFQKINGFSNEYWHWGYEDDDSHMRCLLRGLTPLAYSAGRFISLPHAKSVNKVVDGDKYYQRNKHYFKRVRRGMVDISCDGLNNVEYRLVKEEQFELYTKIAVSL